MLRPCSLLAAAALLVLPAACNCGSEGETPAADGATAPAEASGVPRDQALLTTVAKLGGEGAMVLVVRPGQWAALHQALDPWLARLPEAEPLRTIHGTKDGKDLPAALATLTGLSSGPVALDGWDPTRPIVASLGEVAYDGVPGSVTPALPLLDGWAPPVRHQVVVPAAEPATLVGSLAAVLEDRGKAWPALVSGREGARAVQLGTTAVALLPEDGAVRVVIFQSALMPDEGQRLEHMRRRLDAKPEDPTATPALSLLGQPDAVASVWLRPWRMRPLSAWSGGVQVLQALATISSDQRSTLMARGMQILLDTELLMTDEGAELDDLALTLTVDQGVLRLRSASSLTPEGVAILEAAGDGEVIAAASADALVDAVVRADLRAMLEATEPPPALARAERASEVAEVIQEGGYFATLFMGMRHPFGLARTLERLLAKDRLPIPIDTLPTGAHVVWRGMDEEVPKLALAVHWPEGHGDGPLSALVSLAKSDRELSSLRMDGAEYRGRPVTIFGLGGESTGTFDTSTAAKGDALLQVRVSPARIAGALGPTLGPQATTMLTGVSDVVLTWERRGKALVGELAWSPSGAEVEAQTVPVDRHATWDSPVGPPVGKGAACLAEAGRQLSQGLRAVTLVADDQLATVATKALAEAETSLGCAAKDEATAESATALRAMVVRLLADALAGAHHDAQALQLLDAQCKLSSSAEICARHEHQAALPQAILPQVDRPSECVNPYGFGGAVDVRIDGKGVALDGDVVAPAAFATCLETVLAAAEAKNDDDDALFLPREEPPGGAGAGKERRPSVGLTVDEAVTMAHLRPLLRAMADHSVTELVVSVRRTGAAHDVFSVQLSPEFTVPKAAAPSPPPPTGGLYGMKAPPGGVLGGSGGLFGDWALLEVGKGTVTTSSSIQPEPQAHTAASFSTLREATAGSWDIQVHGADDATWADVAAALAVNCDHTTLALGVSRP